MVKQQIEARGIHDTRVLAAMGDVPRHIFIPHPYNKEAYDDCPLPIGNGQTISQPYIVALMTSLLKPQPDYNVLEIGAGSGYQAAILSILVRHVTTVERIPEVATLAKKNLDTLHYTNIEVIVGDGTQGYPKNSPYDGIIITAATPRVPPPLVNQLADAGRLVVPIGNREVQELVVMEKMNSTVKTEHHGGVRFVPLIGEYGWSA
ncbi:MAG: protein-L-isoaspartate(D-aspartate) O-methyltransferase [Methanoregula sp.]|jgi:protein-L-isoaspartate(D-aspartate) O-methyltransferase